MGPERMTGPAREQDALHQGNKRFALVSLARGQINAHRDAVAFDQEVDFGAEAAARVAQCMFRRLDTLPGFRPR